MKFASCCAIPRVSDHASVAIRHQRRRFDGSRSHHGRHANRAALRRNFRCDHQGSTECQRHLIAVALRGVFKEALGETVGECPTRQAIFERSRRGCSPRRASRIQPLECNPRTAGRPHPSKMGNLCRIAGDLCLPLAVCNEVKMDWRSQCHTRNISPARSAARPILAGNDRAIGRDER